MFSLFFMFACGLLMGIGISRMAGRPRRGLGHWTPPRVNPEPQVGNWNDVRDQQVAKWSDLDDRPHHPSDRSTHS